MSYGGSEGATNKRLTSLHVWSQNDELSLISVVKSLVSEGWRLGTSWRPGFYKHVQNILNHELPGCAFVSETDISIKLSKWTRDFNLLHEYCNFHGMHGIDELTHQLIVLDEDAWLSYIMFVPAIRNMRLKTFPYYTEWLVCFC